MVSNYSLVNTSLGVDLRRANITFNYTQNIRYDFNNSNVTTIAVINNSQNYSPETGLNNTTYFLNRTNASNNLSAPNALDNKTQLERTEQFAPVILFFNDGFGIQNRTVGYNNTTTYDYIESTTYKVPGNTSVGANRIIIDSRRQENRTINNTAATESYFQDYNYTASYSDLITYNNTTSQSKFCIFNVFNTTNPIGTNYTENNCTFIECTDPTDTSRCITTYVSNYSDPSFTPDNTTKVVRDNLRLNTVPNAVNTSLLTEDFELVTSTQTGYQGQRNTSMTTTLVNSSSEFVQNFTDNVLNNATSQVVTENSTRNTRIHLPPAGNNYGRYYDFFNRVTRTTNADGTRTNVLTEVNGIDNTTQRNFNAATNTSTATPINGPVYTFSAIVRNETIDRGDSNYTGSGVATLSDTSFV